MTPTATAHSTRARGDYHGEEGPREALRARLPYLCSIGLSESPHLCDHRCMLTVDEQRFYRRLRPGAAKVGHRINRIENAVESGWPDVLVRTDMDLHVWLELKIAKGPNARIKVRPEQISWAEDHSGAGGRVWLLAQNSRNPDQMWIIDHTEIRERAEIGCLGAKCLAIRHFPRLLRRFAGEKIVLQYQNPTLVEERQELDFTPKRGLGARTVLSPLCGSGI